MSDEQLKKQWSREASDILVGKKIVAVRYMTKEERDDCGWFTCAVILRLDDGTLLYPMMDDEGNNAGALATTIDGLPVIPVI